jgi:hypothetical protein
MATLVANTVAGLGTPSEDGIRGVVRTAHVEMPLRWSLASQVWISDTFVTMRINESVGLTTQGTVLDWRYPGSVLRSAAAGRAPHAVHVLHP